MEDHTRSSEPGWCRVGGNQTQEDRHVSGTGLQSRPSWWSWEWRSAEDGRMTGPQRSTLQPPTLQPPPLRGVSGEEGRGVGAQAERWGPHENFGGVSLHDSFALGCRVKPRRLRGHTTTIELQTCTLRQTPPKFHERTNRRGKKIENWRGKKSAKFWGRGPTFRGPTLCGPNSTSTNWLKSKLAEVDRAPPFGATRTLRGPPLRCEFFFDSFSYRFPPLSPGPLQLNFPNVKNDTGQTQHSPCFSSTRRRPNRWRGRRV